MYRCAANFNVVRFRFFSRLLFDLVPDATAAAEREKAKKKATQQSSRVGTPATTPKKKKTNTTSSGGIGSPLMSGASTPVRRPLGTEKPDQQLLDLAGLNLQIEEPQIIEEEIPKITLAREKLLEEVTKALQIGVEGGKKGVNLVVIGAVPTLGDFLQSRLMASVLGHVDAGKSTLMGRMLYELGKVDEKERVANERASGKMGKSSFSWAWQMDGTAEERERYSLEF